MDRQNLTSYPLKLPFIRSSKVARKESLFEKETCVTEFGDYRYGSEVPTCSQFPNTERTAFQPTLSGAPSKKAPIEIHLDNFRKKAVEMGFSSNDYQRMPTFEARPMQVNQREPFWPQSQRLPATYFPPPPEPPLVWSQPMSDRDRGGDRFYSGHHRPFSATQPAPSGQYPTQRSSMQWPESENFPASQPAPSGQYPTQRSSMQWPETEDFPASQPVNYMQSRYDDQYSVRRTHDYDVNETSFFLQQSRPMLMGSASIPCGTLAHDSESTPALPRYCRWYGESSTHSPVTTRSQDRYYRRQSECSDDSASLRGLLSQFKKRKFIERQPRENQFRKRRNYSSPLLSTMKSRGTAATFATGLDTEDEDWDLTLGRRKDRHTAPRNVILELSPIAKSSPQEKGNNACRCCKERKTTNQSSQTCSPTPRRLRNRLVQTDDVRDRRWLVDSQCQTSPPMGHTRLILDETSTNLFASQHDENEPRCTSLVVSDPDEEFLANFSIGIEREP